MGEKVLRIAGRPAYFSGSVRLPPSKSYLHRVFFVSAIASSESRIINCGAVSNEDAQASIASLRLLGIGIVPSRDSSGGFIVTPGMNSKTNIRLNARGSGT